MSNMVESLIKKAFGTSNANEAASFLASAINRLKGNTKPEIQKTVEHALEGVNFCRSSDGGDGQKLKDANAEIATLRSQLKAAKAATPKTKTVYADRPETMQKLRTLEARNNHLETQMTDISESHLKEMATQRVNLMREMEALRERHSAALDKALHGFDLMEKQTEQLNGRIADLEAQLEKGDTSGRVAELEAIILEMLQKGAVLDQQRQEEIGELTHQLEHYKQLDALSTLADKYAEEEAAEYQEQIKKLEAARDSLQFRLDEMIKTGQNFMKQRDDYRASLVAMTKERDELRARTISYAYRVTEMEGTIKTLRAHLQIADERIASIYADREQVEKDREVLRRQLAEAQLELHERSGVSGAFRALFS